MLSVKRNSTEEANLETFHRKNRARIEIIACILAIAADGSKKTHIMYRANLSFLQLQDCLNYLIERKLLEAQKTGGNILYKTTDRGLMFLENYRQLQDQLLIPGTEGRTPK